MALAGKIAFTGLKLAIGTVLEEILGIFGTSIEEMSATLAKLFKQLATFVAKINSARANFSSKIAKQIGKVFGVEVTDADSFAIQRAKAFENRINKIDVSKLGGSINDALDPEKLKAELAELTRQAEQKSATAAAKFAELKGAEETALPDFLAGFAPQLNRINEGFNNFASLTGSAIARQMPGQRAIPERQLDELKKVNENLGDVKVAVEESKLTFS